MKTSDSSIACAGMDVHYKFSNVTFRDQHGNVVSRQRLDHTDRQKLRRRLSQWPTGLPVVMEASFGWAWLSDMMLELSLEPHLSNCFKVEQMRKARGLVKTNKKDSDLSSLLPFEPSNWWEVYLASPAVRDRREWMRYRSGLVGLQTETKNRIHAIFHRHGIFYDFSNLFGSKGREFLCELCRDGCPYLSEASLATLRGQVRLLDHLRKQLAQVTWTLKGSLERSPLAMLIKSIPGFGLILCHVLIAEIGELSRFGGQKALASYSLLAPRSNDSGQEDPEWRAMFDRVTDGGKKNRNRGYIKVARELVKVVYVVWKKQMPYNDSPAPRPGTATCGKKSRPGTGQLYHPMVPAVSA